jgi:hypothetical protein
VPIDVTAASNWSGYILANGPFTSAEGTFTVPDLASGATCTEMMSEWVGIDGDGNDYVIQAGIGESVADPEGGCTLGQTHLWAWWELFPAASVLVPMTVSVGDQVAVGVTQVSGTSWKVQLTDLTTGIGFTEDVSYSGPASSAEWVVEAPYGGVCGGYCVLPPYTPAVPFSEISSSGPVSVVYDCVMNQKVENVWTDVSTPTELSAWPSDFGISYTGGGENSYLSRPLTPAAGPVTKLAQPVFNGPPVRGGPR